MFKVSNYNYGSLDLENKIEKDIMQIYIDIGIIAFWMRCLCKE